MSKYIVQLRWGEKITNADGTVVIDDWASYTNNGGEDAIPKKGELVLEYDNGLPRLKIGDGVHPFAELEYLSVDSFILPTPATITLYPDEWKPVLDDNQNPIPNRYYQQVQVNNATVTSNSKVDLQPTPSDLAIFHEKDIAFTAINAGGNVRVCVVGQKPTQKYTFNATVTEVCFNG